MSVATAWGVSAAEMSARYPCDDVVPHPAEVWFRGVSVRAPRSVVFRWLCQIKVAPYSWDLLDNWGRRSPRTLTPGLERLETGQRFATIFELVDFAQDEQLTLQIVSPAALACFGPLTLTYAVADAGPEGSRLVVKLNVGESGDGLLHRARRRVLAWGDLFMMRRQLTNLRTLAEQSAAAAE